MQAGDNILKQLGEKDAELVWKMRRGLIVQPGAIGDCVLTLPLVKLLKEHLGLGGVDILGHTDYVGILPGRNCVDGVRSIEMVDLHRLFVGTSEFDLADRDPLISAFADYTWVVTFLGEADSNFEQNLIFTINCSHSAEVITLSMKPPKGYSKHLTDFYMEQLTEQSGLSLQPPVISEQDCLISCSEADKNTGRGLLKEIGIDSSAMVLVIQPGSGGLEKCCHLDNFLVVAKELALKGVEVIFLLGPAEQERFDKTTIERITDTSHCMTDLSLTEVLAVLSCADGFVGNDSGITHLAAGMGLKTTTVFGPTNPQVYRPVGPAVTVLSGDSATFTKKASVSLQQELLAVLERRCCGK